MKAKDTVMSYPELVQKMWERKDYDIRGRKVSANLMQVANTIQAEITFKAGIREVVDWSDDICILHGDADARVRHGHGLRKGHCKVCWQAKLKEWGIE